MTEPAMAADLLVNVSPDSPAAMLLVNVTTQTVVYANPVAAHLAPGVTLPASTDAWSDAAHLHDLSGSDELSDTGHPLSRVAGSVPLGGQGVTAARATELGAVREPLWVVGLPLSGAPGLDGHALVVFLPLRERQALADAGRLADEQTHQLVRQRAVLAIGMSFTVADAQAPDLPLIWVNPAFTATTGYSEAESIGRNCRFLQGPGTDPAHVREMRAALASDGEATVTLLNYRKDGSAFWNLLTLSSIYDAAGVRTHYVGIQSDITARVMADDERDRAIAAEVAGAQELREERDLSDQLLATMGSLVVLSDLDGRVRRFNPACQQLTGVAESDILGRRLAEVLTPPGQPPAPDPFVVMRSLGDTAGWRPLVREEIWWGSDGAAHTVALTHTALLHPDGTARGLLSAGIDVTDRNLDRDRLAHRALHDPLTGLANRALLDEHLSSALARAARQTTLVAVLFCDLDNFKQVNDLVGHAAGDQLLVDVAGLLRGCLRETDTAARLGGDEFVVVAESFTREAQAEDLARRIGAALRMTVAGPHGPIDISVSIGVVVCPADTGNCESGSLLQEADAAMYEAKRRGRDRYHVAYPPLAALHQR